MIAIETVTDKIAPLHLSDTGDTAKGSMEGYKLNQLPVVDEQNHFLGLIYHADIVARDDLSFTLDTLQEDLIKAYVKKDQHLYEVIKLVHEFDLSIVAVVDDEEQLYGTITLENILHRMADTASITEPGGILVVQVSRDDYAMTQIAQIIEGNDAKILSSYITSEAGSQLLDVTLKVSKKDLDGIIQTFERYEYNIVATYQETMIEEDLKNKFEELMNYINM